MRIDQTAGVSQLVARILRDESVGSCRELRTSHLTEHQRDSLKELLRAGESPLLACDVVCGPG